MLPGAGASPEPRGRESLAARRRGGQIQRSHLVKQQMDSLVSEMVDKGILFTEARREFEKRFIARVLQRHRGNLSKAAKDLKIHRNTLGKKIDEYKL
jgi:transcriptional regulator with PAS, ATPase and Fis domain